MTLPRKIAAPAGAAVTGSDVDRSKDFSRSCADHQPPLTTAYQPPSLLRATSLRPRDPSIHRNQTRTTSPAVAAAHHRSTTAVPTPHRERKQQDLRYADPDRSHSPEAAEQRRSRGTRSTPRAPEKPLATPCESPRPACTSRRRTQPLIRTPRAHPGAERRRDQRAQPQLRAAAHAVHTQAAPIARTEAAAPASHPPPAAATDGQIWPRQIEPPWQPRGSLAQPTTQLPGAAAAAQHARAPAAATRRRAAVPCRQRAATSLERLPARAATSRGERKPRRRLRRPGFAWRRLVAAARRREEVGERGRPGMGARQPPLAGATGAREPKLS